MHTAEQLLHFLQRPHPWDEEPVFVFTSDVDWASEEVLELYLQSFPIGHWKPTLFLTHDSPLLEAVWRNGGIGRGIHPNFLDGSSHGNSFQAVMEHCKRLAPEAIGMRSHRLFSVSDTAHLARFHYGFRYQSNTLDSLGARIHPQVHESTLLEFPIFFEDGTFLFQNLGLSIRPFEKLFASPGLKIISFHPMNLVFNTPAISWMRRIKDSMPRDDFNRIDCGFILKNQYQGRGIAHTVMEIFEMVERKNYRVFSLDELYYNIIDYQL